MDQNAGRIDRAIRVILGVFLLSLFVVGPRTNWGLLGLLPLLSGAYGYCPLYRLFGVSTCQRKPPETLSAGRNA